MLFRGEILDRAFWRFRTNSGWSPDVVSVEFKIERPSGGAFLKLTRYATFNAELKGVPHETSLRELVGKSVDYAVVSEACRLKLYQSDIDSTPSQIDEGTKPVSRNFSKYALTDEGLAFRFDQGQVAAEAEGCPEVFLEYGELRGLVARGGLLTGRVYGSKARSITTNKAQLRMLVLNARKRFGAKT